MLLHKLRDIQLYNIFFFITLLGIFTTIFISRKGIINFNNSTGAFFLIYILLLMFVLIISLINFNRFGIDKSTFFISSSRLFLMPIFCFLVMNLINEEKDFKKIIFIYALFIVISSFTLFYQNYFGRFLSWDGYQTPRYGAPGYASLTGNVVTYGPSLGLAVFYFVFISKINSIFRIIFISSIIIAVFFTMSKSAFANVAIVLFLLIIFFKYTNNKISIIFTSVTILLFFYFNEDFNKNVVILLSQVSGVEIEDGSLNNKYIPFSKLLFDRLGGGWFLNYIENFDHTTMDILFGKGLVGGSGALSSFMGYDNHPIFGSSVNTFHNTYLDFFQIAGIVGLFIFTIFFINVYFNLLVISLNNNKIALVLLLGNTIFLINCFVANGIMFQPYTSFSFWIAVSYLIKFKPTK